MPRKILWGWRWTVGVFIRAIFTTNLIQNLNNQDQIFNYGLDMSSSELKFFQDLARANLDQFKTWISSLDPNWS